MAADAVTSVVAVVGLIINPLTARIRVFRNLEGNAETLLAKTDELRLLQIDVHRLVQVRLLSDQENRQSNQVQNWFNKVESFLTESANFYDAFAARAPSCRLRGGCWSNYRLAKRAVQLLEHVEILLLEGGRFLNGHNLVIQTLEKVLISFECNAKFLPERAASLRSLKADLFAKVNSLLSEHEWMQSSHTMMNWSQRVDGFFQLWREFDESLERTPICSPLCESPSSACGCSLIADLKGQAIKLLEQVESLISEGKSFADNHLIIPAYEKIVLCLKKNAHSLSKKEDELRYLKADLLAKIRRILSQDPWTEGSNRLSNWLRNAEHFMELSSEFADSIKRMAPPCSPPCYALATTPCGCSVIQELRGRVTELLEEANLLIEEGNGFTDDQLVNRIAHPAIENIPIYTQVVGQEDEFAKVLDLINGDEADVIGIHGMGGVGKTTLLEKINNHFYGNPGGFDIVVCVTVPRDMDAQRMQRELSQKLGLHDESGKSLCRYLMNRRFLLLLDDVWDPLRFGDVGIPPLDSSSSRQKVVFTTRSKEVCYHMKVREEHMIEVGMLTAEQSWELFCLHVNNNDIVRNPSIEPLAREVANKCGGLPLALIAVGRAMAGARNDYEWRNAGLELERSAHAFPGMEDVLYALKFSFDGLKKDVMREILLYCSLYPENYNIFEEDLLGLLMEEDLFDANIITRDQARSRAQIAISHLINTGLLIRRGEDSLKLHDCIRDMAVWLTSVEFDRTNLFLRWSPAQSSHGLPDFLKLWEQTKRVSMISSEFESVTSNVGAPHCGKLLTLLWESAKIVKIPDEFFIHMPYLRVLNLSNSRIKEVPRSIGRLACLKYLNLQSTYITSLPEEVGDLVQLVQLILRYTCYLSYVPHKSISRLHKLQKLDMLGTDYLWSWTEPKWTRYGIFTTTRLGLETLDDLTGNELSDIGITIKLDEQINNGLAGSKSLAQSITHLEVLAPDVHSNYDYSSSMQMQQSVVSPISIELKFLLRISERIQTLQVTGIGEMIFKDEFRSLHKLTLSEIGCVKVLKKTSLVFPMLSELSLSRCSDIYRFMWTAETPKLRFLRLDHCTRVKILFTPSEFKGTHSPFPCLRELVLRDCWRLSDISRKDLIFPSLEKLDIGYCHELKKLPFGNESAPKLKMIRGSVEWWEQLTWAEESVRSRLLPCFVALVPPPP